MYINNFHLLFRYDQQFNSIADGLKTLIHTAKISIGLINQALDTKGLGKMIAGKSDLLMQCDYCLFLKYLYVVQLVSATDFLNNLSGFPANFAKSEGLDEMPIKCIFRMNGVRVVPADLNKVSAAQ